MADKPIQIVLRRHSADGPLVAKLSPTVVIGLLPEILAALHDCRGVLEEMLRIDREHGWGYASELEQRVERVDQLLKKLGAQK